MNSAENKLSRRERQIMDVIYRLGEATAKQIQDEFGDSLANATIRTVLRTLESKGNLKHHMSGREFVYTPARSPRREAASAMKRVVSVFFKGSMANAFTGMINGRDSDLSDDELDELASIIEAARKEREQKK